MRCANSAKTKRQAIRLVFFVPFLFSCNTLPISRISNSDIDKPKINGPAVLPALPSANEIRISPFVFYSDRPLPKGHKILNSAASLQDSVCLDLKIAPPKDLIFVYIFGEKGSFDHYLQRKYPNLPPRRAFFMAQRRPGTHDEDLIVLTWWSDKLEQDLRHELTHALIHTAIPDIPLWLDEGLAEYYELQTIFDTSEERRIQALSDFKSGNRPNIHRLEQLLDIHQMGREEYREAWCWTRWILIGSSEARAVFMSYLCDLKKGKKYFLADRILSAVPDFKEKMVQYSKIPIKQSSE